MYANTTAGCQNNAICENNKNSSGFICHCKKGFYGHLCQQKSNSCDYSLNLCGENGHCIPNEV